jgi:hypothetical protein
MLEGDQYMRYDIASDKADPGYPQLARTRRSRFRQQHRRLREVLLISCGGAALSSPDAPPR